MRANETMNHRATVFESQTAIPSGACWRTPLPGVFALALRLALLAGIASQLWGQSFITLGTPEGGAGFGWSATSISNDGSVITLVSPDRNFEGAFWLNGAVNWLRPQSENPHYSQPVASADGRYIVYQDHQVYPNTLVRYDLSTGERLSTGLAVSGSGARWFGVSGDGSRIVGGVQAGSGTNGAVWTSAGLEVSDHSLSTSDTFRGISPNGQNLVGRFTHPTLGHSIVRFVGDSFDFFSVNSYWDSVGKISNDGSVFFGNTAVGGAFIWSDALGEITRPTLPPTFTSASAFDMTGDGRYVVGSLSGVNGSSGMIWDTQTGTVSTLGGYLGYEPTGWTITSIDAISANGLFLAGTGIFDGQQRAWAYTAAAIPEPSTYAVFAGLASLLLVGMLRCRKVDENT